MKILGVVSIILFICFIYIVIFSLCKAAGEADRQAEKLRLEYEKQDKQE